MVVGWVKLALLSILILHVSAEKSWSQVRTKTWWGHRGGETRSNSDAIVSDTNRIIEDNKTAVSQTSTPAPEDIATNDINASSSTNNITTPIIIPEWQRRLPPPLCNKTKTLKRIVMPHQGDKVIEIYLLGTAHVSNDSSRDVQLLLDTLQPHAIFVELCDARVSMMEDLPPNIGNQSQPFWERVQEVQQQPNMPRMQAVATVLLTQVQEEYATSLGVELGGEFRVAYKYWRSNPGIINGTDYKDPQQQQQQQQQRPHMVLGDRPVAITLARAWESLSWWGKTKVLVGLVLSAFQKPNPEELRKWIQSILVEESDVLTSSLADLRRHFPSLEKVIIQERDAYMACKLYQTCRAMVLSSPAHSAENNNRIVIAAIVGAGHVPGICDWLVNGGRGREPEEILMDLITCRKYKDQDVSSLAIEVSVLQDYPQYTT